MNTNNWMKVCPYVVVRFLEDNEKSEVPSNWLESENKCWWPPSKDVRPLIGKRVEPVKDKWKLFDIEVENYCENYEKARKKADDLPSSETEAEKGRGKRKKITKFSHRSSLLHRSSSEEEEHQNRIMLKSLPKFPDSNANQKESVNTSIKIKETTAHPEDASEDASEEAASPCHIVADTLIELPDLENEDLIEDLTSNECHTEVASVEKSELVDVEFIDVSTVKELKMLKAYMHDEFEKMFRKLTLLQLSIENLEKKNAMENQRSFQSENVPNWDEIKTILPLKSIEDLKNFEKNISENDELRKLLLKYYMVCGGSNVKDKTIRLLKRTINNEAAAKTSWLGQRNNYKLGNTVIIATMKEAVSVTPEFNEKIFEDHAKDWVRQSKQRYQREKEKEQ